MLNVGIVGYGNIGKSVENQIKKYNDIKLIKIFSSRNVPNCESVENIEEYEGKIDLMFLCVGSKSDLERVAYRLIPHFCLIDCYDNHSRLKEYIAKMNELAILYKKVSLVGMGWDPGIFSLIRAVCCVAGCKPYTFWGKGVSQGHTQALKTIKGVKDAVQFTIPNKSARRMIKNGVEFNGELHKRVCYVVCDKNNRECVRQQIVKIPNYFKGCDVKVKFVSQKHLEKIKTHSHKGEIVAGKEIDFSLKLVSNPDFTARVMLGFARVITKYMSEGVYGCFSILNIRFADVLENCEKYL